MQVSDYEVAWNPGAGCWYVAHVSSRAVVGQFANKRHAVMFRDLLDEDASS